MEGNNGNTGARGPARYREHDGHGVEAAEDLGLNGIANSGTSSTILTYSGSTLVSPSAALLVTNGGAVNPFTAMIDGVATGPKALYGMYGEGVTAGVKGVSASGYGVYGNSMGDIGVVG